MKKYIKCGIIGIVLVILCFGYSHINKMHYVYDRSIDPIEFEGMYLEETVEYEQDFVCKENSIDGVSLKVATSGEQLDKTVVSYTIIDENGEKVGNGEIRGDNLKNNKYNKLKVKRIEDVKNHQLTFKCSAKNVDENNSIVFYNANGKLVMKYYNFRFDLETFVIACGFCLYVVVFMKLLFKLFKE